MNLTDALRALIIARSIEEEITQEEAYRRIVGELRDAGRELEVSNVWEG